MAERLDARQWGDWWRNRSLTSFHGHFQNNYDGPLKLFWEGKFAELPQGAAVLDLATGNGALALLAAEYSAQHDRDFHITGIDYAAIQPDELREQHPLMGQICFLGNTAMEKTGLDSASQNLIMSQFGFEYGNMPAVVKELHRLLKPGGCFSAMVHHRDSAVLEQAREALAQIKRCEKSGIAETAAALVELQKTLARKGVLSDKDQQHARQLHQTLGSELEKLNRYAGQLKDASHVSMFTHSIMVLFDRRNATRISPEQRLETIDRLVAENHSYHRRMKDLRSAAYGDDDFQALTKALERRGFDTPRIQTQDYAGSHFCHAVSACLRNSNSVQ
ncbi:MAG TPA: class I SAM-dependent methyltransferase [Chromatiaceae bacterium]|nr:class I SAM-dependent methyltransferase [Chromatiaceae bacterium]